jgi:hypothetical protein
MGTGVNMSSRLTYLACDKDAVPGQARLLDCLTNCFLVLIYLRCVDMPVTQAQSTENSVLASISCLCLEDTKSQNRQFVLVI